MHDRVSPDLCATPLTVPPSLLQKCDGAKPACQQCARAKKSEACEYDDGKGKTRTQLMREHIQRLESRIKDLEGAEHTSPAVTLFDPHAASPYFSESSSSSSHDSPGAFSLSTSASPVPFPLGRDFEPISRPLSHAYTDEPPSWEDHWSSMSVRRVCVAAVGCRSDWFAQDFAATQLPVHDFAQDDPPLELAQML